VRRATANGEGVGNGKVGVSAGLLPGRFVRELVMQSSGPGNSELSKQPTWIL